MVVVVVVVVVLQVISLTTVRSALVACLEAGIARVLALVLALDIDDSDLNIHSFTNVGIHFQAQLRGLEQRDAEFGDAYTHAVVTGRDVMTADAF